MPTTNPRVNVTLSPSTDALVSRMARLQRVSKSQVLRELLEAAEPALQRAAALMEAASRSHRDLLEGLAHSLDTAQTKAEQSLSGLLADMEAATGDLVAQAQAVRGRRPAGDAQAAPPAAAPGREAVHPLPPAKVQAHADTNGIPPAAACNPPASNRGVKSSIRVPRGARKGQT